MTEIVSEKIFKKRPKLKAVHEKATCASMMMATV